MKKFKVEISWQDYQKLHAKIKELETAGKTAKIGKRKISDFFLARTTFTDAGESIDIRVKRIILIIAGDTTSEPSTLGDTLSLKLNLQFLSNEFSLLQIRLDRLVKEFKSTAKVSNSEASNCKTVKDCIDLVNKKIS